MNMKNRLPNSAARIAIVAASIAAAFPACAQTAALPEIKIETLPPLADESLRMPPSIARGDDSDLGPEKPFAVTFLGGKVEEKPPVDEKIAELTKPQSSVSASVTSLSSDRSATSQYDGFHKEGTFGSVDADILLRDEETGTWKVFKARNLGLDSPEARASIERQGQWGASVEKNVTTRVSPLTFTTGLQGIGTSSLVGSGSGASATPMQTVRPETRRDATGVELFRTFGENVTFSASHRSEDKKGNIIWGRGSAPEFALNPIDSNISRTDASVSIVFKDFQSTIGYQGIKYDTNVDMVSMITKGAAANTVTYLSQPLDNSSHKLFGEFGYNFSRDTRGTFNIHRTRTVQNEQLPTSSIAGLAWAGAPTSLDGLVVTTAASGSLSSRLTKELSLVGSMRYHDLDDKTPARRFIQGTNCNVANPTTAQACVDNTPLSFTTSTAKVEASWRPASLGFSARGGLESSRQDRSIPSAITTAAVDPQRVVPMRAEIRETTARIELKKPFNEEISGSIRASRSKRTGSAYSAANSGAGGAPSDLVNPVNIADRVRDKVGIGMDWNPLETVSVQAGIDASRDRYPNDSVRKYGLVSGSSHIASVDISWAMTESWKADAWIAKDLSRTRRLTYRDANSGAALADKDSVLSDSGMSLGLSIKGSLTPSLKAGIDASYGSVDSRTRMDLTLLGAGAAYPSSGGVSASPFPDYNSSSIRLGLNLEYAVDKNSDVRFDLVAERWRSGDPTWLFSDGSAFTYGTTTDGTIVDSGLRRSSAFASVKYTYKFR